MGNNSLSSSNAQPGGQMDFGRSNFKPKEKDLVWNEPKVIDWYRPKETIYTCKSKDDWILPNLSPIIKK